MSSTATRKTVQPKTTFNYILDSERLVRANLRLNNFGRMIISRHHSDNTQLLLTQFGFNWLRDNHGVDVIKTEKNSRTRVDRILCEKLAQETFYRLVDLSKYPDFVAKMYAKPENISFRSVYRAKDYFEKLNEYGHNRAVKIPNVVVSRILGYLTKYMTPWINDSQFDFDLKTFLETGKWLTHIKTNSNSGYPDNVKQDKTMMTRYASVALHVFEEYCKGEKINWAKLGFELGYRTERKGKHRVICMAPTIEKVLSSVISTFLDLTANTLPFNLPRKYGGPENQIRELMRFKGNIITKDFEAFDTSVPIHLFEILLSFFKTFDNTLAKLICFELDLIIHSFMIVGPELVFWIAALPSGIGVTQFIGSLIHWVLDLTFEIETSIAMYQSDDNIARTDLTRDEVQRCADSMTEATGMVIAPFDGKSSYDETTGKFLQKVMHLDTGVFYNHEQRAYTNGIFRERQISDDTVFNLLFDTNGKDVEHKKMVLAYLGNIVSYGKQAPSLNNILAFLYGRRSGFTATQVKWGLNNLQKYMTEYLAVEEHRPLETVGWCSGFFEKAIAQNTWSSITPEEVGGILSSL